MRKKLAKLNLTDIQNELILRFFEQWLMSEHLKKLNENTLQMSTVEHDKHKIEHFCIANLIDEFQKEFTDGK